MIITTTRSPLREAGMVEKKSDDVQYFNRRSFTYENSLEQWLFFDRIQKAVLNMVEKEYTPEVVLDVGCGTGRLLRKVKERWPMARLIGVDGAAGMIAKARQLMPYATFYVSNAESLPLPDDSVDLALSTASFHHWQDKEKALREIKRVLRLDGRFYLGDIWPPFGLSRFTSHFRSNNPVRIRETFADAGLHVKDQRRRLRLWLLMTVGEHL
jgi:ubiquinone/menaquinone biosynthesis C-methylase UbiE